MDQKEFDRLIELKSVIARSLHTAQAAYRRHLTTLRRHANSRLSILEPGEYKSMLRRYADTQQLVG